MRKGLVLYCLLGAVAPAWGQKYQVTVLHVPVDTETQVRVNFLEPVVIPLLQEFQPPPNSIARIFRGTKNRLEHSGMPIGKNCILFHSTAIRLPRPNLSIHLPAWRRPSDLAPYPGRDGTFDEDYVVVFETGRRPNDEFLLRREDAPEYFRYGVEVHVIARGNFQQAAAVEPEGPPARPSRGLATVGLRSTAECGEMQVTETARLMLSMSGGCAEAASEAPHGSAMGNCTNESEAKLADSQATARRRAHSWLAWLRHREKPSQESGAAATSAE